MSVRVHTAPPLPPFIHCAHDSPHPPLPTPDQSSDSDAVASHVPVAALPNCWTIGAGVKDDSALDDEPPPLPVKVSVIGLALRQEPEPAPVGVKVTVPGIPTTVKVRDSMSAMVPPPGFVTPDNPMVKVAPDTFVIIMVSPAAALMLLTGVPLTSTRIPEGQVTAPGVNTAADAGAAVSDETATRDAVMRAVSALRMASFQR
jgi:hypothetical protein